MALVAYDLRGLLAIDAEVTTTIRLRFDGCSTAVRLLTNGH